MSLPSARTPVVRWVVLGLIIIVLFYTWNTSSPSPSRPATLTKDKGDSIVSVTEALAQTETYVPIRIHDMDLSKNHGRLGQITQPKLSLFQEPIENARAALFPAFKATTSGMTPQPYNPYPDYNSRSWRRRWRGKHVTCEGPHGALDSTNMADTVLAFKQTDRNLGVIPPPTYGSFDDTGLDAVFCFDRFSRYDPYGFSEKSDDARDQARKSNEVDWTHIDWASLQDECLLRNFDRFGLEDPPGLPTFWLPEESDRSEIDGILHTPPAEAESSWLFGSPNLKRRTAMVLHVAPATEWPVDTTQYIRSLIVELNLQSGAEYEVILLVETKNPSADIFTDEARYEKALKESVPTEFTKSAIVYNKALIDAWYAKTLKHNNGENLKTQALQLLSLLRPDFEYFWLMNKDVRHTGHHYQHLETMSAWSKAQPRRLLWERSSRFFVPGVHGDWARYSEAVLNSSSLANGGIWGPQVVDQIDPIGPPPPYDNPSFDSAFDWGIGEDADLISTTPIIEVGGSAAEKRAPLGYPDAKTTPTRQLAYDIMTRYSKQLLRAMHHGQISKGHAFAAESNAYAVTVALHHGLKAVTFPMPIYLDYAKHAVDVDREYNYNGQNSVINNEDGKNKDSKPKKSKKKAQVIAGKVNLDDIVQKFDPISPRLTYYPAKNKESNYADDLYKRWLGYGKDPNEKLCLPGMLLYAVKGV